MSKGDPILLPFEKAEKVLDSDQTSVKIMDEEGNWTGRFINKSFLVSTDVDVQATREENMRLGRGQKQIAGPNERGTKTMKDILEKNRPTFLLGEEA